MKSIVLIYTVKSVTVSSDRMPRQEIGTDLTVYNPWDDYLVSDPSEKGEFIADNRSRLLLDVKAQGLIRADLTVTTCPTLTPTVEVVRLFIGVPVIAIGDAMVKASVTYGEQVLIVAIAGSTVHPTVSEIEREGETAGKKLSIDTCMCAQAFQVLKAMNMEKHDRILMEKAKESTGYDCIVPAQASIAHLEYEIAVVTGYPMLTSPGLRVEEIKQKLASLC